jgi:hypothetical protein
MNSLFWIDDERFIGVEVHIAFPFGRDRFLAVMEWIRENQKPGGYMRFRDTQIFRLSPDVSTSVSIQEIGEEEETTGSRVLLVYVAGPSGSARSWSSRQRLPWGVKS